MFIRKFRILEIGAQVLFNPAGPWGFRLFEVPEGKLYALKHEIVFIIFVPTGQKTVGRGKEFLVILQPSEVSNVFSP